MNKTSTTLAVIGTAILTSVNPIANGNGNEVGLLLENSEKIKQPRANWFDGYDASKDMDVLASLPADEASEEWEW